MTCDRVSRGVPTDLGFGNAQGGNAYSDQVVTNWWRLRSYFRTTHLRRGVARNQPRPSRSKKGASMHQIQHSQSDGDGAAVHAAAGEAKAKAGDVAQEAQQKAQRTA